MANATHVQRIALSQISFIDLTLTPIVICHKGIAKVEMEIRLIGNDVLYCLLVFSIPILGMGIGDNRKDKGAALCSLGMKRVLTAHFIVTIIDISIPIVDHPVVIARVRAESRDDYFVRQAAYGSYRSGLLI